MARDSNTQLLSAARTLPGQDLQHIAAIEAEVLRRFAWADGLSAHLSNTYRRAMMARLLLAALAVPAGVACLQWERSGTGWLALLAAVPVCGALVLAAIGHRCRWYWRWREARRVAEYLRHACLPLLLGVARPAGRWPVGMHTSWPEWYARHALREPGLPRLAMTPDYLHQAVQLLQRHVGVQLDYYRAKARHMAALCRLLDRLCLVLLALAMSALVAWLLLASSGGTSMAASRDVLALLGATLPAFAAAAAGIRYFGDFERLAEISSVTAEKLQAIGRRAARLLAVQDGELDYGRAAHLAHALEEVVASDIESWQPVFGGSDITLPL